MMMPFSNSGSSLFDMNAASHVSVPPAPTHPVDGSPPRLSILPSDDSETLMDSDSTFSCHGSPTTALTPSSVSKRKRYIVDPVLLSPLAVLDPSSSNSPSPSKKARQSQYATPLQNTSYNSDLQQNPMSHQPDGRDFREGTSLHDSLSGQDSFVTDMESCLDSILNQLADETQRREALQETYASGLFGEPSVENSEYLFPSEATEFFPESYDHAALDDELSQSLFEERCEYDSPPSGFADWVWQFNRSISQGASPMAYF
ncbi:hypothetical protein B0H13DRAFT_634183 [Mycena leptocephala]|nr:hypothetical protein B0H13DRAFT_634183 [Mycena leptocephala]